MRNLYIGLGAALGAVVLVIGIFVFRLYMDFNQFTTLWPNPVGACTDVATAIGPEDVVVDHDTGLVYTSAYDRRTFRAGTPVRGALQRFDLNDLTKPAVDVAPTTPADFKPHGISFYKAPDGQKRLFVINHPNAGGHVIEIFDVAANGDLTHAESITSDFIITPNDVHAVGPRQFYVSNDHANEGGWARRMEDYFRQDKTSIAYFDGETSRTVADGLTFANGINGSPDGSKIYVTETTDMMVRFYDRDIETGDLTLKQQVPITSGLDNIDVHPDGSLWIGAHPKLIDFQSYASGSADISPSQVITLKPQGERGGEVNEIYLDLGEQISGSSVGARWQDKLIIGSVFEEKVLVCDLER